MRKVVAVPILAAMVLTACNTQATPSPAEKNAIETSAKPSGEPIVYKIAAGLPESHYEIDALKELEKYVEEKTNGTIDVQIFPNNQLGDDKEALQLIQQGVVQMCPSGTSTLANFEKSFNLLSTPYLFKDQSQMDEILNGEWGQQLLGTLDKGGFIGLGYGSLGFTSLSNNIKPIVNAGDLEGLKLRCIPNALLIDFYKSVGANPVSMSFSEVFAALQQGVIEGQSNPLSIIYSTKLHEVQKYISKSNDTVELVVFTVGKDAFNHLTAEQQEAIKEGVAIASAYMSEQVEQADIEAEKNLLDSGLIEINEVPQETRDELFKQGYEVIEKFGNEANPDLFEKLKQEMGF